MASLSPARVLNMEDRKGQLLPGRDADLTVLDKTFSVRCSMVNGKIVFEGWLSAMDPYARITLIRKKNVRTIAGLMSGTSTDGLTIAITETKGSSVNTNLKLIGYKTFTYPPPLRSAIFQLFDLKTSTVDKICNMNFILAEFVILIKS